MAAKVLGGLLAGGHVGYGDLVAGLEDASPDVRRMCVRALASSAAPAVITALLRRLRDSDPWVRVEALEVLAPSADARVTPALTEALSDPDACVRLRAAIALAEAKHDPAGIRVLVAALDSDMDPSLGMVVAALEALTGSSLGEARHPALQSSTEGIEAARAANAALVRRWQAWWQADGQARFPQR